MFLARSDGREAADGWLVHLLLNAAMQAPGAVPARSHREQVSFAMDVWVAAHRDPRQIPRVAMAFEHLNAVLEDFLA